MPPPVSVIVPALDEEARIGAAIDSAFAAGAAEVVVADGGSRDATVEIARARGARVIRATMRARQLNAGAAAARHDTLIFLHADTILPPGAASAVLDALDGGAVFGGFRIEFIEPSRRLRCAAWMINFRTRLTRAPWGDQAQFTRREVFERIGGYREIALMEDYDLASRMKRAGRAVLLPLAVRTSGRRFLKKGVMRTAMVNWLTIAGYHAGVPPERLARWYRG